MRPSRRLPPPAIDYPTRIVILSEYATADESKDLTHDATKRRLSRTKHAEVMECSGLSL
jgi:hypothetical protein